MPGRDQGLLYRVLGSTDVSQDPVRHRHEPIADCSRQIGERFLITLAGQVHECLLHPVLPSMRPIWTLCHP